jgi:hypothetical protein
VDIAGFGGQLDKPPALFPWEVGGSRLAFSKITLIQVFFGWWDGPLGDSEASACQKHAPSGGMSRHSAGGGPTADTAELPSEGCPPAPPRLKSAVGLFACNAHVRRAPSFLQATPITGLQLDKVDAF